MKDLDHQSKTIYLDAYKKPDFLIDHVDLKFELEEDQTRVLSTLALRRQAPDEALVLMGEGLVLGEVNYERFVAPHNRALFERLSATGVPVINFSTGTGASQRPEQAIGVAPSFRRSSRICSAPWKRQIGPVQTRGAD